MIVYCITNAITGKKYVGQTRNTLAKRWWWHKLYAARGSSSAIHGAIRKYGESAFKLSQLDVARSLEELNQKEIFYIKQLNTLAPSGYNLTTGGDVFTHSEETRAKMSRSLKGRTFSQEARQRMSAAKKGILKGPLPEETRRKMSEANRGQERSAETRKRMSDAAKRRIR